MKIELYFTKKESNWAKGTTSLKYPQITLIYLSLLMTLSRLSHFW